MLFQVHTISPFTCRRRKLPMLTMLDVCPSCTVVNIFMRRIVSLCLAFHLHKLDFVISRGNGVACLSSVICSSEVHVTGNLPKLLYFYAYVLIWHHQQKTYGTQACLCYRLIRALSLNICYEDSFWPNTIDEWSKAEKFALVLCLKHPYLTSYHVNCSYRNIISFFITYLLSK